MLSPNVLLLKGRRFCNNDTLLVHSWSGWLLIHDNIIYSIDLLADGCRARACRTTCRYVLLSAMSSQVSFASCSTTHHTRHLVPLRYIGLHIWSSRLSTMPSLSPTNSTTFTILAKKDLVSPFIEPPYVAGFVVE